MCEVSSRDQHQHHLGTQEKGRSEALGLSPAPNALTVSPCLQKGLLGIRTLRRGTGQSRSLKDSGRVPDLIPRLMKGCSSFWPSSGLVFRDNYDSSLRLTVHSTSNAPIGDIPACDYCELWKQSFSLWLHPVTQPGNWPKRREQGPEGLGRT